ncbi:MAG TPA: hypothetical protein PKC24_02225 [Cyclobacteriaceae bacterium]|nr:hypothetical protein [Cyclobacteriaceae bacterium]
MKTNSLNSITKYLVLAMLLISGGVYAQQAPMQYFRSNDKNGLNVFETSKEEDKEFDGIKVRVGGDFAMQFQGLSHSNTANNLVGLGKDFTLPTANLNLDVQLHDGVRMHLRTYLSSKHHNEAWVKGGFMQMDKLDFIKEGFLEGFMKYATITVGLDEFNYGDAHFRRSDNARAIFNPFVGNYIMDSFSTEAFGELTLQNNGLLLVVGLTNGKLNQNPVNQQSVLADVADNKASFYGKVGFDKQMNDDLRVRLTGSWYMNNGINTGTWLYGGDRAGSRYYHVMRTIVDPPANPANQFTDFDGRFNARFQKLTAVQLNPFIKFQGLEFFGIYEVASGKDVPNNNGAFTQVAGEILYRFGADEQYYIGGRYNTVSGKFNESATVEQKINRVNIGGGWFLTKNVLAKIEYVNQQYNDEPTAWTGANARFNGGRFEGFMIEAVIGF